MKSRVYRKCDYVGQSVCREVCAHRSKDEWLHRWYVDKYGRCYACDDWKSMFNLKIPRFRRIRSGKVQKIKRIHKIQRKVAKIVRKIRRIKKMRRVVKIVRSTKKIAKIER